MSPKVTDPKMANCSNSSPRVSLDMLMLDPPSDTTSPRDMLTVNLVQYFLFRKQAVDKSPQLFRKRIDCSVC